MLKFVFGKTMPHNPHFYVVRDSSNNEEYVKLYMDIYEHSIPELYYGK